MTAIVTATVTDGTETSTVVDDRFWDRNYLDLLACICFEMYLAFGDASRVCKIEILGTSHS